MVLACLRRLGLLLICRYLSLLRLRSWLLRVAFLLFLLLLCWEIEHSQVAFLCQKFRCIVIRGYRPLRSSLHGLHCLRSRLGILLLGLDVFLFVLSVVLLHVALGDALQLVGDDLVLLLDFLSSRQKLDQVPILLISLLHLFPTLPSTTTQLSFSTNYLHFPKHDH